MLHELIAILSEYPYAISNVPPPISLLSAIETEVNVGAVVSSTVDDTGSTRDAVLLFVGLSVVPLKRAIAAV